MKIFFKRSACPCCGCLTFDAAHKGECFICPVCFWEDDPFQADDPDLEGSANAVSLNQARENYKKYGACEERFVKLTRAPKQKELPRD